MAGGPASSVAERVPRSASDGRGVVLGVIAVAIVLLLAWIVTRPAADPVQQTATVEGELPRSVGAWSGEQLEHAAIVMRAGRDLGMSERDVRVAVMTAMGESSLRVLDRGDRAGPDSRGLFQQRDPWGPYEVRMDAYGSAVLFYRALAEVGGRDGMVPTRVAHAVQINRDPDHYARWWDDAGEVVAAVDEAAPTVVVEPACATC
ncbi:MAG: peptidase M23 [Actinomycetota bacterium]